MGFLLCPDAIQLESAFELLLSSDSDGFDGKREKALKFQSMKALRHEIG